MIMQILLNPLQDYLEETGDYFRKYAKKHNGPKIQCIKYYDGEVKMLFLIYLINMGSPKEAKKLYWKASILLEWMFIVMKRKRSIFLLE